MAVEVRVPEMGESIREVQIVQWHKQEGQWIDKNENLVELETDKATVQLPSPTAGTVVRLLAREGDVVNVGSVIASLDESARPAPSTPLVQAPPAPTLPPAAAAQTASTARPVAVMPAAEHLLSQYGLSADDVPATGPGGRLLKEDVLRHAQLEGRHPRAAEGPSAPPAPVSAPPPQEIAPRTEPGPAPLEPGFPERREEVVPMTLIRRRIAQRLVQAQQQAALLTTFNEADMSAVMELRKRYRDAFQERYHVKLGFMSFFVKAVIEALKRFPQINAEIRGDSIVYRNYYDIGIAVGSGRGLVVPVLRSAERMSFAEIEQGIAELADRAHNNALKPDELLGGTFTISNGGIYGSMLSTPIVNPPQSGILGLHAIQDRPVARDGQVVIRPMMYLALSYDHRIVDGREAVGFLRTVKEDIEDPARLILEI